MTLSHRMMRLLASDSHIDDAEVCAALQAARALVGEGRMEAARDDLSVLFFRLAGLRGSPYLGVLRGVRRALTVITTGRGAAAAAILDGVIESWYSA